MKKEGEVRIPSGCAVAGIVNRSGKVFTAQKIVSSIANMRNRSNGLGGGFAGYGIYPEMKDCYALHLFYRTTAARQETEEFLRRHFQIKAAEMIPTRKNRFISDAPDIWRYFLLPKDDRCHLSGIDEEDYVARCVMRINSEFPGATVASGGKNMGVFKAVGFPEDVADFYRLEDYQAYLWMAHGRFPTNTPGWWGGAHPFTLLDWAVVHNGEISSYDANRRYLEMRGYRCNLQTDTEVITYLLDLLVRKDGLPLRTALGIMAAPFWEEIDLMDEGSARTWRALRAVYGSALLNGPFSIIVGCRWGMIAMNDRIKLRPLVAAVKGDYVFVASEEAAIRAICPCPDLLWAPKGGEPVYGLLEDKSGRAESRL
ncbi:MAG: hypothetical protein PWP44_1036 [Thermacetogenium sp.]|nr:hypothetical protein [Thermacetogenium sp.]